MLAAARILMLMSRGEYGLRSESGSGSGSIASPRVRTEKVVETRIDSVPIAWISEELVGMRLLLAAAGMGVC